MYYKICKIKFTSSRIFQGELCLTCMMSPLSNGSFCGHETHTKDMSFPIYRLVYMGLDFQQKGYFHKVSVYELNLLYWPDLIQLICLSAYTKNKTIRNWNKINDARINQVYNNGYSYKGTIYDFVDVYTWYGRNYFDTDKNFNYINFDKPDSIWTRPIVSARLVQLLNKFLDFVKMFLGVP
jgi:hypothetical protein